MVKIVLHSRVRAHSGDRAHAGINYHRTRLGFMLLESVTADPADLSPFVTSLRQVLNGQRSVLPLAPGASAHPDMRVGEDIAAGTLIASTSGSTGTPKGALLSAANLLASAHATDEFLRREYGCTPSQWLLALPPQHIAGTQVVVRSLVAGHEPVVARHLAQQLPFSVEAFVADTRPGLLTSLVPAQLARLAAHCDGVGALKEYQAILVGGAATPPELVRSLRAQGVRLVLTYGSSETAGGMVYDGHALPGGSVSLLDPDSTGRGRIVLSGPMVARGYRNLSASNSFPEPGTFVTSDLGTISDATLTVVGRADGAINSGGYKVLPEDVERAVQEHCPVQASVCVGLEDAEFGQVVGVLVEGWTRGAETADVTQELRNLMRPHVPRHLLPRLALAVSEIPLTGPGKVDRQSARALLEKQRRPGIPGRAPGATGGFPSGGAQE